MRELLIVNVVHVVGTYIGLRTSATGSTSVSRVTVTSASSVTTTTTCRWVAALVGSLRARGVNTALSVLVNSRLPVGTYERTTVW